MRGKAGKGGKEGKGRKEEEGRGRGEWSLDVEEVEYVLHRNLVLERFERGGIGICFLALVDSHYF